MIKIKNLTNLSYEIIGSVIDWYLKNELEEPEYNFIQYFDFYIEKNKYRMEVYYQKNGKAFCVYKLK